MLNILLVEDEPPILRGIKNAINRNTDLFAVTSCAYNGQQAMEYLENHAQEVHLVITDIQMPLVNGLDLIRHIKTNYPHIPCVILTGFSDFHYAQEAIRLGAFDYLLKPIDIPALLDVLKRVYQQKGGDRIRYELKNSASASETPADSVSQKHIVSSVCLGAFPIMSTSFAYPPSSLWQKIHLEEILQELLPPEDSYWLIDEKSDVVLNIIYDFKDKTDYDIRQFQNRLYTSLTSHGVPVTLVWIEEKQSIRTIGKSIREMHQFLSTQVIIGKSRLLIWQENPPAPSKELCQALDQMTASLAELFEQSHITSFRNKLQELLRYMEKHNCPQHLVIKYLYLLADTCYSKTRQANGFHRYADVLNDAVMLSSDYSMLLENVLSLFMDLFPNEQDSQPSGGGREQFVLMVDHYIRTNFNQPLTTQLLADLFNFTPAYLSKIYREFKNMTPYEYITSLRIQKAENLFRTEPNLKIKDVSALVGYEDSFYFSKVFKKATGLSPKQYIQKYVGGESDEDV
ncbi:response regulator transcription factor [Diplocloster hominis]|uniref:response regulator transcription factor n=1 Tax=Diplocloster hominis TaxID=3079010 RepID=UPI0031BA6718